MDYIKALKLLSPLAFQKDEALTLQKEVYFNNVISYGFYVKLDNIPEVLLGKTFFSIPTLLNLLSNPYKSITDKAGENSGKIIIETASGSKVSLMYSTIVSKNNGKNPQGFKEKLQADNNYYQFHLSNDDIAEIKNYQAVLKTKDLTLKVGETVSLEVRNTDSDTWDKVFEPSNKGDFTRSENLTDFPYFSCDMRIVKKDGEKFALTFIIGDDIWISRPLSNTSRPF